MTPEEKFNQEVFKVLQKIKERSFYAKKGRPIDYKVPIEFFDRSDKHRDEVVILEKLQEWQAIKITDKSLSGDDWYYYLEIIQPHFDGIYKTIEAGLTKSQAKNKNEEVPLKKITKLTIVDPATPDSGDILIVLNEEYEKPLAVKKQGHNNYAFLYEIAKGIPMSEHKYPSAINTFNYNKGSKIYTQTGYEPTSILKVEGGFIMKAIPMNIISHKQYEKLITQKFKT